MSEFELAPRAPNGGRFGPHEVETALTVLALHDGNSIRAAEALERSGIKIAPQTLRLWRSSQHQERYLEISREKAPLIEQKVNRLSWENATAAAEVAAKAIARAEGQLDDPKADAANIAYKLSLVQGIQQDKALAIEGRPSHITAHIDLDDILDDLGKAIPGLVIDSTAEEL